MAFTQWNPNHIIKFNSAVSYDFLEYYQNILDKQIKMNEERIPHQTFAGSSFRCDRRSWFRIRGVAPDVVDVPDRSLEFAAQIGTDCHRVIQSNLSRALKENWIDVDTYIKSINFPYEYEITPDASGFESQVTIVDPPVRFSCDGLIRWNDTYYLLEIKTSEFSAWHDMTSPKAEHIDQVKCYATLLQLHKVLFLYQDRQYGDLKCYEVSVTDADMDVVNRRIAYVLDMVRKNIAPDPLPKGDKWCTKHMCPYFNKCSEYGR